MADDDMVMIRGSSGTAAVSVLLRGANDYMLDEMDRSLHDAFCVVKRVLESGKVVPGARALRIPALQPIPLQKSRPFGEFVEGGPCAIWQPLTNSPSSQKVVDQLFTAWQAL